MSVARAVRARSGDAHCGDAVAHWQREGRTVLCVVDGLGHGREAAAAARAALDYVAAHFLEPLPALFAGCDRSLQETRGVAMGVAQLDDGTGALRYAAVGNTRAMLAAARDERHMVSSPGIVGGRYHRLTIETASLDREARLFLYTDGLPRLITTSELRFRLRHDDIHELVDTLIAALGDWSDDCGVLIYHRDPAPRGSA